MKNFFGTLALFVLAVAVAGAVLAEGGKNRRASEAIDEGYELCAMAGEGAVLVITTELEGGETATVTLDCGEGPEFES